jgi:ABC-type Fe3+/spermidine/putrescine transport system ATPase subunit
MKVEGAKCFVSVPDFNRVTLISTAPNKASLGDACKVVIRTSEIRLSNEGFPDGTDNVLEGRMISREFRGGLTDHRIQVGSRELVVTSHKLCPMIRIDGNREKTFLAIDRSAISVIVN